MAGLGRNAKRRLLAYGIIVAVIAAFCILFLPGLGSRTRNHGGPVEMVFDGPSDQLKRTVIVPTLDTPMPEGKNVIWCASFQLAWNEMRDEIVGEPIRIAKAEEIAARLNNAKSSKDDLEAGSYYVKAGAVADGVIEQIQRDMAKAFPDAPTPEIKASGEAFVAYAYLAANVKFTLPFFDNDERFAFNGTRVSSFGIREKDEYAFRALRGQVDVLYSTHYQNDEPGAHPQFALDLCKDSSPNQIILACIEPGETLDETLASLDQKTANWSVSDDEREFETADVLLVPNIHWRIMHHFRQLEGTDKTILNEDCPITGYWVSEASQLTEFKLDRSGAEVKSEAKHLVEAKGREFLFNRPFLIVMRKRGAEQPFFVMWVDNPELLCKP